METANGRNLITDAVLSFFARDYPLIKLFEYGNDILVYDAKPHFAFILSAEEMDVLIDFLGQKQKKDIIKIHSRTLSANPIKKLLTKFAELKASGVFIKGPVDEISPADHNAIQEQLKYFDENILLRKFCLEVTEDCNYRCTYCKRTIAADYRKHRKKRLSEGKAYQGIDYYFQRYTSFYQRLSSEKKKLLIKIVPPGLSWYGGEPFLNFQLMKKSAAYFKSLPWNQYAISKDDLRFTANTNLSVINDDILDFLVVNRIYLYASLDGPAPIHDKCRVFKNGRGTFDTAYNNLLKIKKFNEAYFRERVSIFGVYTDRDDYDQCAAFNRNIGALRCEHFPAEYTGIFVPDLEAAANHYVKDIGNQLADFKRKILAAPEDAGSMENFSQLFPFAKLNDDHPSGRNSLQLLITCPMGFDNLMVAANGDFLICHKVNDCLPIGHCGSGLDMEKLTDLNLKYNSVINNDTCKSCWNVSFCTICAASRMVQDHFINPTPEECDFFRLRTSYNFLCFIHLSLEHPDLLEKIFAYRNNRKFFIGVIDINEF